MLVTWSRRTVTRQTKHAGSCQVDYVCRPDNPQEKVVAAKENITYILYICIGSVNWVTEVYQRKETAPAVSDDPTLQLRSTVFPRSQCAKQLSARKIRQDG